MNLYAIVRPRCIFSILLTLSIFCVVSVSDRRAIRNSQAP